MNISGVTISPQRPIRDFGEDEWTDLTAIENAVVIGLTEQLFVPRGSDLKTGDRFKHQDKTYWVRTDSEWDIDHPMSGVDMGYVELKISLEGP